MDTHGISPKFLVGLYDKPMPRRGAQVLAPINVTIPSRLTTTSCSGRTAQRPAAEPGRYPNMS